MYYFEYSGGVAEDNQIILEPEDWTDGEWKTLLKLFGLVEADRIVLAKYKVQAYGTPTDALEHVHLNKHKTKTNRWWYSEKQKAISYMFRPKYTYQVFVDGEWREYTEWTTSSNGKCNWDDAILITESAIGLPIMVNGVKQI